MSELQVALHVCTPLPLFVIEVVSRPKYSSVCWDKYEHVVLVKTFILISLDLDFLMQHFIKKKKKSTLFEIGRKCIQLQAYEHSNKIFLYNILQFTSVQKSQ